MSGRFMKLRERILKKYLKLLGVKAEPIGGGGGTTTTMTNFPPPIGPYPPGRIMSEGDFIRFLGQGIGQWRGLAEQQRQQSQLGRANLLEDRQQLQNLKNIFGTVSPLGPGIGAAYGIDPYANQKEPPKSKPKEIEIPMQQPTGKRRIKLVD